MKQHALVRFGSGPAWRTVLQRCGWLLLLCCLARSGQAQDGLVEAFPIEDDALTLTRLAQPDTYFDKTGRRFAVLGTESGRFEAWAYPLKLFRDFRLSFFIGSSTEPIHAREIVQRITARPAATTITYTFQSFTVHAHFVTPVHEPGALILLEVDSTEPLTIVSSFLPVLQPMWPAGLGGQYAYWHNEDRAYIISEPSRGNHGYVGSPAATGLSYTPAHMLSDQPNQFRIVIDDPEAVRHHYIPIAMAGGKGAREEVRAVYRRLAADPERAYRATVAHFDSLRSHTLRVETPDERLNTAFAWALVSYDNLLVDNPDFEGTGLVAGLGGSGNGGRPGFGWFFGGDTYINTLSLNAMGYFEASRDAIAFLQPFQREDGKMAHEVTQAIDYVDWFEDYPYAYIHADTSPYYIAALYDYFRMSGDTAFVRQSWPSLQRAYAWSRATDADGDGLMDNQQAGLGALEFGSLTEIQTDIYLGAVWTRATYAMQQLAAALGDDALAAQAGRDYAQAREAFEQFWNEETGQYAYAFSADGSQVDEVTPWSAVGLMWGLGTPARAARTLERLSSAELTTDWGVRMMSVESPYFEPLNYNYGAVWPFLTSWVNAAQFKHDFNLQGYATLRSTAQHVYNRGLGHVAEVFSGAQHTWPQESVPHQGFCTAGTVLPFVRGLLGLEGDATERRLVFEPRFPADWPAVHVDHYRLGTAHFGFDYERTDGRLRVTVRQRGDDPYRLRFAPALGVGTRVQEVTVNGQVVPFETEASARVVRPVVDVALTGTDVIEVAFAPAAELLPPVWASQVGDRNQGLKIIAVQAEGPQVRVEVEGWAGRTYTLPVRHPARLHEVHGAAVHGDELEITLPDGPAGTFVRHTVTWRQARHGSTEP